MCLAGTLKVLVGSEAQDIAHLVAVGIDMILLHLEFYQFAREHHLAQVVTGIGLNDHDGALLERQMVGIMEIALAGILKLHFYQIAEARIVGHVAQPIRHRQHMRRVASRSPRGKRRSVVAECKLIIHIIVFS